MATARASAHGLRLNLGGRCILDGIGLDFTPGRVYGILRPNSCDKTTLIRALSSVLHPDAGEVRLDDAPVRMLSPAGLVRVMAIVWQGGQVSGDATVRRLIGYGCYAYLPWRRLDPSGRDPAIEEAMVVTGVVHLSRRLVASLSSNERQRVWIVMTLAQQPKVLLLGEPTIYLDIAHQLDVLELIHGLNRHSGLTVIMVLHDLTQAVRYCNRCIMMDEGRVRADGVPAEVLSAGQIERSLTVNAQVTTDPSAGHPVIVPRHRVNATLPESQETEGAS